MQKIIYWLQWSWKTKVWKEISELNNLGFIDLDEYIVHNKLNHNSVSDFIKLFDDSVKWWETFRHFEFESLREVLEQWYSVISVWWWTLSFDRNIDTLSNFEILKIFLEVDVKTQIERLTDDNATWNQNRYKQTSAVTREQELTNLYDTRIWKYRSIADWIIDTNNSPIEEVVSMVNNKISFLENIIPLRNEIDNIDAELISILQSWELINRYYQDINTNFEMTEVVSDIFLFIRNKLGILSHSKRVVNLLKSRCIIVQKIWELKRKYNETPVQWNRKEQVRKKWLSWWEKLWEIYDFIHNQAIEIEKKELIQTV